MMALMMIISNHLPPNQFISLSPPLSPSSFLSPFQVSHLRLWRHGAGDLPAEPSQQRHPAARRRPLPLGEGRPQLRDGRLLQRDHRVPGQLHGRQRRRQPDVRWKGEVF